MKILGFNWHELNCTVSCLVLVRCFLWSLLQLLLFCGLFCHLEILCNYNLNKNSTIIVYTIQDPRPPCT